MTDENNNTPANDTTSSEDARRRSRARNKVVEYADADAELRGLMDRVIAPIDAAPDSFEAIIDYGHPPLEELGKVANQMIAVQTRFNSQVNVMADAMTSLQSGLQGMNLHKFADATKNVLKGFADAGAKTVGGSFSIGKKLVNAFKGGNKPKEEDQKLIEEMQTALPAMLSEMVRLTDDLSKTESGIQDVLKEAEKLGIARLEATRSLNVYLGAGKEVLRRYNEVYIPEAQEAYDESGDPNDEMYLKDMLRRKDDFIGRLTTLEGSRLQGVVAAQQLKQIMETMEDQLSKIQDIKHNSSNEWKAMLAAAGIAGSSLKAAQILRKADEFGDKMQDQTTKMLEESHQITLQSKSRGTVDPQKLIEAANRLGKMLEAEHTMREQRLKQLDASQQQLRGAADKLIEAVSQNDQMSIMDGTEDAATQAGINKSSDRVRRNRTNTSGPQ